MKMDSTLIERVLNNEASADEAERVVEWFATDEGAAYLLEQMGRESRSLSSEQMEEWIDHHVELKPIEKRMMSRIKHQRRVRRVWMVAAVLIPALVFGGLSLFLAQRSGLFVGGALMEVVTVCGEQARVVLHDGTMVQLNADSRLRYPRTFALFSRRVELSGEAYFSVKRGYSRPFYIQLDDAHVKVTGTEFNVKAYASDSFVRLTLTEGKVALIDSKEKEHHLLPGQQAEFDRVTGQCRITTADEPEAAMAWRTKSLNFYRTPLRDILKTLEREYDVRFGVESAVALDSRFTYSGAQRNLEEVLSELEKVSRVCFSKDSERSYVVKMK